MLSLDLHPRLRAGLLTLGLTALVGCGRTDIADDDHDHGAGEMAVTGWSASHEAYVTMPPLIAGEAATGDLHLTDLATGAPVAGTPLTLVWRDTAGGEFTRSMPAPTTDGVYEVAILMPTAGHWQLEVIPAGAATPVIIDGLHVAASVLESIHDHAEPGQDDQVLITMTKAQQWRLGVVSAPAERTTFTQPLRVAATVEAPPERRVVVATPVGGRVSVLADRRLPVLGQAVRAGEPLVAIRVPLTGDAGALAGAESDLVGAREDLQLAEAELTRARALVAAQAAPARRVEEAEAALSAARARHAAAARLLDGGADSPRRILVAPIDGVITGLHASPGQYVEAGARVLTVLDPSRVWVRGHIPETALHDLPPRPRARLGVHGEVGTACDIEGAELMYLAPEIDPASRTAAVVYAIDNDSLHLRVGQSLGLALDTTTVLDGLVVPNSALIDEQGRTVVVVQLAADAFAERHVPLGRDDRARSLPPPGRNPPRAWSCAPPAETPPAPPPPAPPPATRTRRPP